MKQEMKIARIFPFIDHESISSWIVAQHLISYKTIAKPLARRHASRILDKVKFSSCLRFGLVPVKLEAFIIVATQSFNWLCYH